MLDDDVELAATLQEWIESLPAPEPIVLTEWQRDLLKITYGAWLARDLHAAKMLRPRHPRLAEPEPADPARTDWERTLGEIRADWRQRHLQQLLSEQRLNEVSLVNIPTGS